MERTTAQSNMLTAGIDVIDRAWGGLYRGAAYLLYGPAAAGRGLLPLLFAHAGASRGERCLYVSAGRPRDLTLQASSLGFDLRAASDDGRVRLVRIPPVFDTSEEGDEALVNALRGLAAEAAQHRPDRLIIDDFTPFVQFRSFERFGLSLSRLFEALPETSTLMLALGEPASPQSERVIQFVRNQVFGTLHLELTEAEEASARRLTLVPNIGHLRHEVIDDWDLEAIVEAARHVSATETAPSPAEAAADEEPAADGYEATAPQTPEEIEPEAALEESPTVDPHDFAERETHEEPGAADEEAYEEPEAITPEEELAEAEEPAATEEFWVDDPAVEPAASPEAEATAFEEDDLSADAAPDEAEPEAYKEPALGEAEELTYEEHTSYEVTEEDEAAETPVAFMAADEEPFVAVSAQEEEWTWEDEEEPAYDAYEEPTAEDADAEDEEEELKYFAASERPGEDEPEDEAEVEEDSGPFGPAPDFSLDDPVSAPSAPFVRAIPLGRARAEEVATLEVEATGAFLEADDELEAEDAEVYASEAPAIGFDEDEIIAFEEEEEVHDYEAFFENGGAIVEEIDDEIEVELLNTATLPDVDYTDRVAFRVRLQQHFLRRAVNGTPFLLIAMRMDRREDQRVRPFDFDFLQDLIATALQEEDDLLVDLDQERLIVLLGNRPAAEAQAFFGQLKNRLRDEAPHQSDYLLHSVSAIVVPDGRPFDTAEEFLTYALDQP